MKAGESIDVKLLPGARALLDAHALELPQKDDLCGAFCGALALAAAGIRERDGEPLDQDAVAIAAGSLVSRVPDTEILPAGETGRRDYRLEMELIDDGSRSGTTASGVITAIDLLSRGGLAAIPLSGPWTERTLDGLFDAVALLERPVTLLANLHTGYLWGGRSSPTHILGYLFAGVAHAGPHADWQVGHFTCLIARADGPGGRLYAVADTYPSLGNRGLHVQPSELLAAAIARRERPAGGLIVVCFTEDAPAVRAAAADLGLSEGIWDNGTPDAQGVYP